MNLVQLPLRRSIPGSLPTLLAALAERGGFCAGGFPRWLASERKEPAPYSDLDIWCAGDMGTAQTHYSDMAAYCQEQYGDPLYDNWIGKLFRTKDNEKIQLIQPRTEGEI